VSARYDRRRVVIVEAIAKAHGGDVTVKSELNVQTTFTVRLPAWGRGAA
jgi:signal transduction histidine kinase